MNRHVKLYSKKVPKQIKPYTHAQLIINMSMADYSTVYLLSLQFIRLKFLRFDTETNYDFVKIYNGSDSSAKRIGNFHGHSLPGDIISQIPLFIHFYTDVYVTNTGFTITYTVVDAKSGKI